MYQKVVINMKKSIMLTLLRDSMLPKLILGELRVAGAEHML